MEVARNWRIRKQRYSLQGILCNHCGTAQFPARPVCSQCGGLVGCEETLWSQVTSLQDNSLQVTSVQEKSLPVAIKISEKSGVSQSRG